MTPGDAALPFSAYAEGVAWFIAGVAVFLGLCWLVDRLWARPGLRRHVDRALSRGDLRVLTAVEQMERIERYANGEVSRWITRQAPMSPDQHPKTALSASDDAPQRHVNEPSGDVA